jgi:hypothetical protein
VHARKDTGGQEYASANEGCGSRSGPLNRSGGLAIVRQSWNSAADLGALLALRLRKETEVPLRVLRFLSVLFTAIVLGAGLAHLFELPNKINLTREKYLTVQQIYSGWALIGIALIGALILTAALAVAVRKDPKLFPLTLTAMLCLGGSLLIFFAFTYPANQQTNNWTFLPSNWQELRKQWEYSHAVNAVLYLIALSTLVWSLLAPREPGRQHLTE